jgi:hypothetical protein
VEGSDRGVNGNAVRKISRIFREKSTAICQNNRFRIRDLNPAPSDCETGALRCFDRQSKRLPDDITYTNRGPATNRTVKQRTSG